MTIADQVRRLIAQHLGIDQSTVTDDARCMGFLLWVGLGASVGYGVAQRRDVSTTTLE